MAKASSSMKLGTKKSSKKVSVNDVLGKMPYGMLGFMGIGKSTKGKSPLPKLKTPRESFSNPDPNAPFPLKSPFPKLRNPVPKRKPKPTLKPKPRKV